VGAAVGVGALGTQSVDEKVINKRYNEELLELIARNPALIRAGARAARTVARRPNIAAQVSRINNAAPPPSTIGSKLRAGANVGGIAVRKL
jgi:hypothetical protein